MIAHPAQSLDDFFRDRYTPQRLLGCCDRTVRQYRLCLTRFEAFLGRAPVITDLTSALLCQWFSAEGFRWGPASFNQARKKMLALSRFAVAEGILGAMPEIPKVREYRRQPTAWTLPEVERLLVAAAKTSGTIEGVPAGDYWVSLVLTLYWLGIRPNAAFAITWTCFDWGQRLVIVEAETQKNRSEQLLRMPEQLVERIRRIEQPTRRLVWPWPFCETAKWDRFRPIVARAGLPTGRRNMYGKLRRTTATLTHANGGDATWQLGHSSDAITRQFYLDPRHRLQAADVLPVPQLPAIGGQRQLRLF